MKTEVVVVQADRDPIPGIQNLGPHQIYRNPSVSVVTRELGELHPDEVRVEMIYAGLCGTDVHLVETGANGYIRCSAPARIPPEGRVIGHEGVGRVVDVGAHVRHVKPGAVVTFESIIVCHYCDVCRRGQFNQCLRARLLGLEKDGLFGTLVDVPSMLTHDVSELSTTDAGLKAAACVEPAGVAYVACENMQVCGGDEVLVFGGGPIGLFCAILSKTVFGASRVYLVEPVKFRRDFASPWCDAVFDVPEFFEDPPRGVDVVIEASGHLDNVNKVFRRINSNGRVAFLARSGAPFTLDAVDHMITNAITLMGSRGHLCGAFSKILGLYKSGRIPLDAVLTEVVEGTSGLCDILKAPARILENNCKVLCHLGDSNTALSETRND